MGLADDRRWLQSENDFWTGARRKEGDRRGFFLLFIAAVLVGFGRLVGCPSSVFT